MSKREASMFAAQGVVDVDAPRAKRHKPGPPSQTDSPDKNGAAIGREVKQEQIENAEGNVETGPEAPEVVKERGLRVWQTVKDAVNKEGRTLSYNFMRLPSQRQYPDYYEIIKHPVSLEKIKENLEKGEYLTFSQCVGDLEICFKNAKKYNVRDSQIWKDAKILHKLVTTEAAKITGNTSGHGEDDVEAPGGSSDAEGDGKKKKPNMNRLLKVRLQKLVDKTDSTGRVLSTEFMDLPDRKKWPIYYKTINKPQCIERIFKRLKRKEYHTTVDFANDVELVFSNAMEFNQEHTGIWEDAMVLRDYFRLLMADLPPPFTIPAYATTSHSTKIKLRMPNISQQQATPTAVTSPAGGALMLRVPPQASPASSTPQLPNSNTIAVNVAKSPNVTAKLKANSIIPETIHLTPPPSTSTPQPPAILATNGTATSHSQSITFTPPAYPSAFAPSQHPNPTYPPQPQSRTPTTVQLALPNTNTFHPGARQQPSTPVQTQILNLTAPTTSIGPRGSSQTRTMVGQSVVTMPTQGMPPISTVTTTTWSAGTATVPSKSPTPSTAVRQRRFEHVKLVTMPNGRRLDLDAKDRVKTWAARLGVDELIVGISGVKFFPLEEGEEEVEADENMGMDGGHRKEEEEEDEQPAVVLPSPKRPRGRPRKKPLNPSLVQIATPLVKAQKPFGPIDVQVKLNGSVVQSKPDTKHEWEVKLPLGCNVLEIVEKTGMVWRVYLERVGGDAAH
ncbi:hypothetical protein BXZ70DRAFT_1006338 [Cristinia sonorae]|uniref:Bromo domain-containing protein n=1 Tax=Cristinia sonorae TaxID=1940300 RepID=A0A8K0USG8_9AGAR|nr:hypothetical protein BXZ70DRAFT_1006338 [Cristinia sonorae]